MHKRKRKEVIDIKKFGRRKEEIINKENEYKGTKVVQTKRKKPLKLLAI
jgi:hypothetical protein